MNPRDLASTFLLKEGWIPNGDFYQDPKDGEWFHVREAMEIALRRMKGRERARRFRNAWRAA